jgi:hypothetical protein
VNSRSALLVYRFDEPQSSWQVAPDPLIANCLAHHAQTREAHRACLDLETLNTQSEKKFDKSEATTNREIKAWRDIWAASHGVRAIHSVQTIAELKADYFTARDGPCTPLAS